MPGDRGGITSDKEKLNGIYFNRTTLKLSIVNLFSKRHRPRSRARVLKRPEKVLSARFRHGRRAEIVFETFPFFSRPPGGSKVPPRPAPRNRVTISPLTFATRSHAVPVKIRGDGFLFSTRPGFCLGTRGRCVAMFGQVWGF